MPLSKEKIEQIRKDAEKVSDDLYSRWREPEEYIACKNGYIAGATSQAEKALCLIEALEKIKTHSKWDWEGQAATAALQSYTNLNKG